VDLIVVPHVLDEDGHLDHVVHPASGLPENGLDVLEDRLRLELYVSFPTSPSASMETYPTTY